MRRFLTAFIIAAMTLPSLALMSSAARAACCCQASGSCPLRKHAGCEKSCSMERSDASPAVRVPELVRDPAVFVSSASLIETTSIDIVGSLSATPIDRSTPPTLPPPRA